MTESSGHCTRAVVVGGGASLWKNIPRILEAMSSPVRTALFDINANLDRRCHSQLLRLPCPKFLVYRAFGTGEFGVEYDRVKRFLTLPDSTFLCNVQTRSMAGHLGDRVKFYDLSGSGPSFSGVYAALTLLPKEINEIHLFGCDAVTVGDCRSADHYHFHNPTYSGKAVLIRKWISEHPDIRWRFYL